ncbi:unnamed protein product [Tilletia controversa]|nr:unnamed protein product [Tilletia controversa]
MSSHASAAPSLSGRRPRAPPHQHPDVVIDVPTLDPRSLAIVTEIRTMREEFNHRFDDVAVRLVAVEQHQQQVRAEDDSLGDDPVAAHDHGRRTSTAAIHPPSGRPRPSAETAWSPALLEDRFVTTTHGPSRSRPAQPPVTPRPLPPELPQAPSTSPYGTIPLARYKQLPGAEQGRIKKALRRIGLSLEHILGSADAVEEDDPLDDDEAFDDEPPVQTPPPALSTPARPVQADSSESPLRIRGHVAATPTPELSPAPNIRIGAPPVCRQEFIGDYSD